MRSAMHIAVMSADSSHYSWNRAIAPLKHLRVLPTRTRPSLFGSD